MTEYYIVTIYYCIAGIFGNREIKKTEIKLFSTEELAIEFLARHGFVYGAPYPFKMIGWYKYIGHDIATITRFLNADITRIELDDLDYDENFWD